MLAIQQMYHYRERIVRHQKICVFCGKGYKGRGKDPWPFAENARCCDACFERLIMRYRAQYTEENKAGKH